MTFPLVSVVIPAYSHERYIGEAIRSVINQDYPYLEIIVVDDGSHDSTAEKAERALVDGTRSYRLIRQENMGAHAALNKGFSLAGGEFIAILNSDDRYHPQRISNMIKAMQDSERRFAFSQVQHIDEAGNLHPYHAYYQQLLTEAELYPSISFALLLNNLTVTTGNFMMHRSLYEEVGLFAPYITCHDWDYVLRVVLHEEPLYIPQELMDYRIHNRNTLKAHSTLVEQEKIAVRKAYFEKVGGAKNPLAPGPSWGSYWRFFVYHDLLPSFAGTEVEPLLANSAKNCTSSPYSSEVYSLLVKTLEHMKARNKYLECEIVKLNGAMLTLERRAHQMEQQLHAPLYFMLRRSLLPIYISLKGKRAIFLSHLKNLIKRAWWIN